MHNKKLWIVIVFTAVTSFFLGNYFVLSKAGLLIGDFEKLPNGMIYQGDFQSGKFHGSGSLSDGTGYRFEGKFKDGLFSGPGVETFLDITRYEGDFVKGIKSGAGIETTKFYTYEGEFKKNLWDGTGLLVYETQTYQGEFQKGKMHGKGNLTYENGESYKGDFVEDEYSGEGKLIFPNGGYYVGGFKKGIFDGQGFWVNGAGESYEGIFSQGQLSGQGTYINGETRYEGEFKNWQFDGEGELTTVNGNYKGVFVGGYLTGQAEFKGKKGSSYIGEFEYSEFNGQGIFIESSGDKYEGEFKNGRYHGEGEFTRFKTLDGIKKFRGKWSYGRLIESDDLGLVSDVKMAEKLLYNHSQQEILQKILHKIPQGTLKNPEIYSVLIAGDGKEEVFRREVEMIRNKFSNVEATANKQVLLVNTKLKQSQYPLATQYSVDYVVGNISKKMNLEEDILLMYITSHGSKQATVTFDHNAIKMNDLSAKYLADILEKNSVKRKILMISACYSGSFIEPLKSDNTLIITSASDKDTSFGCADDSEMTWFAKAFFEEGDGNVLDFVNRFHIATKKVTQWEKQKDYEASNPQIYCSADIVDYLNVKILNRSQVFDEKLCNNKPWWQFW